MSPLLSISNVSWRYKLMFIGVLPILVTLGCIWFASATLTYQSDSISEAIEGSRERQLLATSSLTEILSLERDLQALIAAESPEDIRAKAIATIKASSSLDESLQRLSEGLPGNPMVAQLQEGLRDLRPMQMAVIRDAKGNNDDEALATVQRMSGAAEEIRALAQTILAAEQEALKELADRNTERAGEVITSLLTLTAAGVALIAAVVYYLSRSLLQPLKSVRTSMRRFSEGDLSFSLDYEGRDEVGVTVSALRDAVASIRQTMDEIRDEAHQLKGRAGQVEYASKSSSRQIASVENNAQEILSLIETLVQISEQVDSRLANSCRFAEEAQQECTATGQVIDGVAAEFERFRTRMERLSESINTLAESAASISVITKTIRDVADQTNLLALNAAIEAARAGDQGRGFAVVSDEVRSLARRTGEAVQDISSLADTMRGSVENVVTEVHEAATKIEQNAQGLHQANDNIKHTRETSERSMQESRSVQAINEEQRQSIRNIHDIFKDLDQLTHETAAKMQDLDQLANDLNQSSASLQGVAERFK